MLAPDAGGTNPAIAGYDQGLDMVDRTWNTTTKRGVDAAVRGGLATMLQRGGSAGYQPPLGQGGGDASSDGSMPMPVPSGYAPPANPSGQSQAVGGNLGGMVDTHADLHGVPRQLAHGLVMQESSGNPNLIGGAGEIGLTQIHPATARAPGYGMQGVTDPSQLKDPAFNLNYGMQYLAARAKSAGLNLSDPAQWQKALELYNGGGDPQYAQHVLARVGQSVTGAVPAGGNPAPAGGYPAPMSGNSFMGNNPAFNARYDPILERLSQTPGGGTAALSILGNQSRYDMQSSKRGDNYQKLAMQAAAQGNIGMAKYYSNLGGQNIPDEVWADTGAVKRMGAGGMMAQRLYSGDPQKGAIFAQSFAQFGDPARAFQAAGPPSNNAKMTLQQVYDAANGVLTTVGVTRSGQAVPITNPDGTPLTGNLRPSAGVQTFNYKQKAFTDAGYSPQDAAMMAGGQKPVGNITPARLMAYRQSRINNLAQDESFIGKPPTARMQALDQEMDQMFPSWRQAIQGGSGRYNPPDVTAPPPGANAPPPPGAQAPAQTQQGSAAPAPGPTPARPATVPAGSAYSNSRKMWRDPSGKIYDFSGNQVGG